MRQVLGFYFEGDPLPLPVPPCLTPCLLSQLPACLLCCWSPSEVQTCLSVRSALHHGQPTETDRLRFWRDTHTLSLTHFLDSDFLLLSDRYFPESAPVFGGETHSGLKWSLTSSHTLSARRRGCEAVFHSGSMDGWFTHATDQTGEFKAGVH